MGILDKPVAKILVCVLFCSLFICAILIDVLSGGTVVDYGVNENCYFLVHKMEPEPVCVERWLYLLNLI